MTHASLFSGIGGFDLAAEWAGWTNAFNCEINPFCQTVLKHHFPNATQYSDIKTTDFTVWRGRIDVLGGANDGLLAASDVVWRHLPTRRLGAFGRRGDRTHVRPQTPNVHHQRIKPSNKIAMKTNYNYDFLLPFFASSDDLRPAMKHIHKDADGYVYATDAHIMIRIPADKVGNEYHAIEKFPNAGKLMTEALNRPNNISRSIAVDDLIMVLSKAKWYKEMQGDDCPDCNGEGTVVCEACDHSHECESCNGTGEINRQITEFSLLQDEDYFIVKIEQQCFRASFLHILAISAKVAGVETIEFVSDPTDNYSAALFKFDDVVILFAPTMLDNSAMTLKTRICTKTTKSL